MTRKIVIAAGALCVVAAIWLAQKWFTGTPDDGAIPVYYLTSGDRCVVVFDYTAMKDTIEAYDRQDRIRVMTERMIDQFRSTTNEQVKKADVVNVVAAYINDTDSYGKPIFSSRTNLIQISGPATEIRGLTPEECLDAAPKHGKCVINVLF